ncbi:MAG: 16S rRNA (guanine(527)-N(7))-methyltransferase RsmG [Terriglobales bacterium]
MLEPFLNGGVANQHPEGTPGVRNSATLSPLQLRHISMYIDLLLRWNARINLTAVREPERIVTRHFGESIFVARQLFSPAEVGVGTGPHVIDVGSGAGFPGLPIKIWAPDIHLILIESSQKKATFLREVVRRLGLSNVDVFAGRVEAFPGPKGDVVTFRAVERFVSILQIAARLLADGGCLAILLGGSQLSGVQALLPSLKWEEPAKLPLSSNRAVIIGRKESGG